MSHGMTNVVRIGKETTRGTAVAGTLTVPFVGDGWKVGLQNHQGRIHSSATFPSLSQIVSLGLTPTVRGNPDLNIATIHDIIDMALVRTAGVLPSLTIEETSVGVGQQKVAGCVCRSLEMSYSRSDSPDESALLSASMEFLGMSVASASGITAGTQGAGARLSIAQSTFTLNAVAALEVLSFSWRLTNTLHPLAHGADRALMDITEGVEEHEFQLTARFTAEAWRDLLKNATEHAASFVLDTGGTNETVTLAIGKAQVDTHELQGGSESVVEQITLTPFHTGTVRPVVATFGVGIGASVLALD